jgi:hypothetical protein
MTEIHDLLNQIDVHQMASLLGTDPASAQSAIEAALPTLLAGMHSNAQAPDGAASLESALSQHQDGLVDGGVDASQVDTADGERIVGHVFGGQQDHVAAQLAGTAGLGGIGGDLIRKALPILAPIVMSYLAKKIFGQGGPGGVAGGSGAGQAGQTGSGAGGQAGGIDLGSILGGILGAGVGAGAGGGAGQQGSVLDSILGSLGGILGGGTPAETPAETAAETPAGAPSDEGGLGDAQPDLQGQPAHRSVQPGEVIQVDLPEGGPAQQAPGNDGGLGGILGGLFGKK